MSKYNQVCLQINSLLCLSPFLLLTPKSKLPSFLVKTKTTSLLPGISLVPWRASLHIAARSSGPVPSILFSGRWLYKEPNKKLSLWPARPYMKCPLCPYPDLLDALSHLSPHAWCTGCLTVLKYGKNFPVLRSCKLLFPVLAICFPHLLLVLFCFRFDRLQTYNKHLHTYHQKLMTINILPF